MIGEVPGGTIGFCCSVDDEAKGMEVLVMVYKTVSCRG